MSSVMLHSIHCGGYLGHRKGFDNDKCTCGAVDLRRVARMAQQRAKIAELGGTVACGPKMTTNDIIAHYNKVLAEKDAMITQLLALQANAEEQTNELREKIAIAINSVSAENGSNTPDFILAKYLVACLEAFDAAVVARDTWYGGPKSLV